MPAIPDEPFTYGYVWENRHMVSAFASGRSPEENLRDALLVMELLMAAYKSAEEKRAVKLPDPTLRDYKPKPFREAAEKIRSK